MLTLTHTYAYIPSSTQIMNGRLERCHDGQKPTTLDEDDLKEEWATEPRLDCLSCGWVNGPVTLQLTRLGQGVIPRTWKDPAELEEYGVVKASVAHFPS